MNTTLPYGSWPSSCSAADTARAAGRLSQPRFHRGALYWLESRPEQGGRRRVMCADRLGAGAPREATPPGVSVRSDVHEYGGGDYGFAGDALVYRDPEQPGIQRMPGGALPGARADARYADFTGSPDGRWLVAVEETHGEHLPEPENRLVAFDLASGRRLVLDEAHDFVASPCFSPGGERLVFLSWDHPRMPWDGTELWSISWNATGPASAPRLVCGGARESIFQPGFSADGTLTFSSDRSGFWNPCQERGGRVALLFEESAEYGMPQWVFGMRCWAPLPGGSLLCVANAGGRARLLRVCPKQGKRTEIPLPFCRYEGIAVAGNTAALMAAAEDTPGALYRLDLQSGARHEVTRAFDWTQDREDIALPEAVEFASADGRRVYAFLYRPRNARASAPPAARPPLRVLAHGGPTAQSDPALKPALQFWTNRGFAVLDVNYGGSTGYGRAYRESLYGRWGVVDVEDCLAAARYAVQQGVADPAGLLISGSSAGGFTVLSALTFHEQFAAGASYYGIGDLEALAAETHKFESRYNDSLLGPYSEARALYRERSPINSAQRLQRPVIFFQGLLDRIVPPGQAEQMANALAARGILHAHLRYPDEGHGFRREQNIRHALESELFFYGRVLNIPVDARPDPPVELLGDAKG